MLSGDDLSGFVGVLFVSYFTDATISEKPGAIVPHQRSYPLGRRGLVRQDHLDDMRDLLGNRLIYRNGNITHMDNPMKKIISQLNTQTSILIIFSVIIHILVLKNVFFISKDMIYGDSSSVNISSRPLYGYMRIPISILAKKYYAENRLAADFAQIYFPSKNFSSLSTTYQDGYLDPWGRPSRYAPLLHFICSITLCEG